MLFDHLAAAHGGDPSEGDGSKHVLVVDRPLVDVNRGILRSLRASGPRERSASEQRASAKELRTSSIPTLARADLRLPRADGTADGPNLQIQKCTGERCCALSRLPARRHGLENVLRQVHAERVHDRAPAEAPGGALYGRAQLRRDDCDSHPRPAELAVTTKWGQ